MTTLETALVIAAALIVLVAMGLRLRKLRRDEMRKIAARVERHLMVPPPSPYTPSKGFRLLDGPEGDQPRHHPPRPRLEPDHDYVFSESQLPPTYTESISPLGRHDERWALSKSVRPSRFSSLGARLMIAVLVMALIAIVTLYYVQRGPNATTPTTTTTTTTTRSSSSTNVNVVWPANLVATSTNGQDATYRVPTTTYRVTVRGSNGPAWTVYTMGPRDTLEWQGDVALGSSESLVMTGTSRISLGAPKNATVRVGQSSVVFPSPLPATLTLVLTPAGPRSG
jgi:hypothetical protein